MRVADFAIATHAGRVRRKNEDAYYAEPPLFAVADGMGGALAGEVASRITVQTLAELVEEGSDEERLAATVRLANRSVISNCNLRTAGQRTSVAFSCCDARARSCIGGSKSAFGRWSAPDSLKRFDS